MENGKISVAVIGGGETGTQLLSQLVNLDFVTVTGVSDLHEIAPGMKLAQRHGIGTTRISWTSSRIAKTSTWWSMSPVKNTCGNLCGPIWKESVISIRRS